MTALRSTLALLVILALAVPAAAAEPTDPAPEVYEACADTGDATVVTPDAPFTGVVPTPVGQANLGPAEDAGTYVVDLAGREVGTTGRVTFTLDVSTAVFPVPDYDLIVDGANAEEPGVPESVTLTAAHCRSFDLSTIVFFGVPLDELTISARVR